MSMKKLLSLLLALTLCASLAAPALAAEGADPGLISGAEPGVEIAPSVESGIAPSDAPETAQTDPAPASAPEASPETDETVPIDPNAETADPGAETAETETTAETTVEAIDDEMPLVVTFSDVPASHTFYKGVTYCASKGIVGGYTDGTFRPANPVTKSHFGAMLSRAFYPEQIEKYSTDWYKQEYGTFGPTNMVMSQTGTLNNTSFRWSFNSADAMNTGINRYDMAQMMTNIMKAKGFTASSSQKSAAQSKITDYKNIPSQYQDAVKNVYALGIIGGYGDGRFIGTNIMNRGQAAIVIQRMAQYAPVKGDQDNDTYDDGTEKNPKPNPSTDTDVADTGNIGNTGTTTPKPETKPEPETPATNVLTNGKAITESNVKALLDELKAKWNKQDLGTYGQGNASPVRKVTNQYRFTGNKTCSTTSGCGGGAARVFDAVFGQSATLRPVSGGYDAARPGDVLIKIGADGKAMHVAIVYTTNGTVDGIPMMTTVDANIGSGNTNKLVFGGGRPDPVKYDQGFTYAFYTAYPD